MSKRPAELSPAQPDLTFLDIWKSISKRRRVILYTTGIFFTLAVLVCIFVKPRYQATETIQIEKEGSGPLGLDGAIGQGGSPLDSIDYNTTLQTQADMLQSDLLAVKTIEDLNLEQTYDYRPKFNPLGLVMGIISPKGAADPKNVALHDAPQRRTRAVRVFESHLVVKVSDGTRLIKVSYTNPDPRLAAAVVNHLVETFKEYNYQMRFAATSQASTWLNTQLTDLKRNAEASQAKVAKLQQDAQVYSTGDTDPDGRVVSVSVVLSRLQDLNTSLAAAQSNRILKQAVYFSVKDGGADAISGLAGNLVSGASPQVANSMMVLQQLRSQEAAVKATYAQNAAKYGDDYPVLQELRSQLNDLDRSIDAEVKRIGARAKSDYDIAQQTENQTKALYDDQKRQADSQNSKAIEYTVAKQEANQNQSLYQELYRKMQEAGALAGLRSSNISIVDPASAPGKPKVPNVPIYLALSIVGGIFVGSGLALFVDRTDHTVQSIDQVERELGVAPLVILPSMGRSRKPLFGSRESDSKSALLKVSEPSKAALSLSLAKPDSAYAEALRVLRTAILHSVDVIPPRVLLITSGQPGDGKTSVSLNLAGALAQQGHKVLVVECNMRRPIMQEVLGLRSTGGLSALLANDEIESKDVIAAIPDLPGGFVLPAGSTPSNPAELLGSKRMRTLVTHWKEKYEFIILDTPPVLSVADPLTLLGVTDLVLMLVRFEHTAVKAMQHAYKIVASSARHKLFGVIVNDVRKQSKAIHDYYGYDIVPYGPSLSGDSANA